MSGKETPATTAPSNFIRERILEDQASGKFQGRVATRFPPEPNGYLHIGHAKAIWVDFGLAKEFGGTCNLRFDDTNPTTEDVEYVDAIQHDIRWLGYEWSSLHFASDYFEELYQLAEKLIQKGDAYVDSLDAEQIREYRGDYYKKGKASPYRDRSVAENLELFRGMRAGKFKEGEHVLRAKIDLETQNMNLRDPILYRIRYAHHHRTGDKWCIYPLYDFAHPLSDASEKITHSICTLEFESHRPLYDWCIGEAEVFPSQQIEFARLNLTYTIMSKRKFIELVDKKIVDGWDDPRMPTLAGMRRRGYTPKAIRNLCERTGVAKANSTVDVGLLEHCLREDLNASAKRVMAVLKPLKVVIENFPEGQTRELEAPLHPDDATRGTRKLPFSRVVYIEQDDFREDPPKEFFRLAPGKEVRLRYACLLTCTDVIKDANGEVVELRCKMDPESWGGTSPDGRVVRGTLHWVSAAHAVDAEVRLYDRLFAVEFPGTTEGKSFLEEINPHSLVRVQAKLEPWLATAPRGETVQFERLGYFRHDEAGGWNRAVTLKDTWAKIEKKLPAPPPKKSEKKKVETTTPAAPANASEIGIEEFAKVDLRVGLVKEAGLVEGADKLIRVVVDLGEGRDRQIFAGLRASYPDPAVLVGQRVVVVANLKPRQMKFGLSEGMILAAGKMVLAADASAKPGDKVS
ncbi:MAG: glutaminyl-tRNA synthetase [Myxococcales bacterium]|nr:glutaminyl-tRNA synthetase [Myxococcales bacterium]